MPAAHPVRAALLAGSRRLALLGLLAASALVSVLPAEPASGSGILAAAIVDPLASTHPNATFVEDATALLESAGFRVDYVPASASTVRFFRDLPRDGYDLILLRAHSSASDFRGRDVPVHITTGEPFRSLSPSLHVGKVYTDSETGPPKASLGISPDFVEKNMRGDFGGAVVLMMGCQGLANPSMADAFLARGASAYVGWDGLVSAHETDEANLRVLRHHVAENRPLAEAVNATMAEMGPANRGGPHLGLVEERGAGPLS